MDYRNISFEEVVQLFEPMVKSQILALKIYKDQEDFFQIGLIGLWEAYHRFDPEKGYFPAFAKTTVRGKMLIHMGKESKFAQNHTAFIDGMGDAIPNPEADTLLERELILSYCDGLSEKQLIWVIQGIIENKKPKDIAKQEGVPVMRVKDWRRQALKKILKNYQEMG